MTEVNRNGKKICNKCLVKYYLTHFTLPTDNKVVDVCSYCRSLNHNRYLLSVFENAYNSQFCNHGVIRKNCQICKYSIYFK